MFKMPVIKGIAADAAALRWPLPTPTGFMPDPTENQASTPVVGLTGGISSGKTNVSGFLTEWGAHIIDADRVGHRVIAPDGEAFAEVVAAFGEGILAGDGTIDRRKLGSIVFADPAQLDKLNAISHPRMAQRMGAEIARQRARPAARRPPAIVLDAAILLEAGWHALCDEVWVVVAEPETALARLMARDGLGREEALARLDAQMSNDARMARAGQVIRNDGSLAELRAQVKKLWQARTADTDAAC